MKHIAHVGHTKSSDDRKRFNKVLDFMIDNGGMTLNDWLAAEHDYFDLAKNGRDFLAEEKHYDLVILHFIFRGSHLPAESSEYIPELRVSQHSSWCNWRHRLLKCDADYIFPFGAGTEVSGSFLSLLDGYQLYANHEREESFRSIAFHPDKDFWVYVPFVLKK
jgi:hypothetical protein